MLSSILAGALALLAPARACAELCRFEAADLLPRVPMRELASRMRERIDACATEARRGDAARFCARHGLSCTAELERDYVRVHTLFELTRDGGPFRVRWAITNREPSAREIWKAWQASAPAVVSTAPSVTAECDEISALFAGLARKMGVRGVGLFWPRWNHTIAAWEPAPGVRVLVPTTQIFLRCEDTLDATSFASSAQKTVFEFPSGDVPDTLVVPRDVAAFLLEQTAHYAAARAEVLAAIRASRAVRIGSSVGEGCVGPALDRASVGGALTDGDRRALVRYGTTELGLSSPSAEAVLAAMRRPTRQP